MISLRKETTALADFDNRQRLPLSNNNLLVFQNESKKCTQ
jgi:hypothetical protein